MTEISNLDEHIEIAEEIVFSLGKILRNRSEDWLNISTSSEHDIKLVGDKKAEDFIFNSLIKKSPFPIFGEESGWKKKQNDTLPYWIIDPIDGTVNYLRNIPICCISIALMHKNRPLIGIVHDFNNKETFTAIKNNGAYLNGESIHVSKNLKPQDAILATGFPAQAHNSIDTINKTINTFSQWKKIRMLGSAALSLAYVASGRIDAYHENSIMLWDIAAGWALVEAAGGVVSVSERSLNSPINIFASNKNLSVTTEQLL